jgi:hypothetical protein
MYNQSVGLSPIQGAIMGLFKKRRAEEFDGLSLYVRKVVIRVTPSRPAQAQHTFESRQGIRLLRHGSFRSNGGVMYLEVGHDHFHGHHCCCIILDRHLFKFEDK